MSQRNNSDKFDTMSNAVVDIEIPTQHHNSGNDGMSIGSIIAIGLSLIAFIGTVYNYWQARNRVDDQRIVVVDFEQLANSISSKNDISKIEDFKSKLQQLSNQGVIVLHKESVMSYPNELDITQQLVSELGLSLSNQQPQDMQLLEKEAFRQPENAFGENIPPANAETDGLDSTLD